MDVKIKHTITIDKNASFPWQVAVWQDGFAEFYLQSQRYSQQGAITGFAQMTESDPKAHSLHYKVGFAVALYIQQQGPFIPLLTDAWGHALPLKFQLWEVQILQADTRHPADFVIAVHFTSEPITCLNLQGSKAWVVGTPEEGQDWQPAYCLQFDASTTLAAVLQPQAATFGLAL